MTELRKKELWGYLILAFAYMLSLLYRMLDHSYQVDVTMAEFYPRYEISYYAPVVNIVTELLCILILGLVYFYYLPKYYLDKVGSKLIVILVPSFLLILFASAFSTYVSHSSELRYVEFDHRRLLSVSFKNGLTRALLITIMTLIYILGRNILTDVYERVAAKGKLRLELINKTIQITAVTIMVVLILLFFRYYIHRVWVYSIMILVPQYLVILILALNYVYPAYSREKDWRKLILRVVVSVLVVTLPLYFVFSEMAVIRDTETSVTFFLIFALSIPLFWFFLRIYYNDIIRKFGAMDELQLQVDTKTANIDFLRSQINPHFLFNALNTLYGLSLTEKAERTAEGVQKLGDMMRFVLTDNQQQKVSIDKEVNYISNFIDLQKLRTQASDKIVITFKKYSHDCNHLIAPMLLIPLIENAFKHGISLTQPSWITIHLTCDDKKVYLDVYNSVHPKSETDTEKHSNGIGLRNVQQRLSLLYPNKHELQIRNTPHEYIVHLTIEP